MKSIISIQHAGKTILGLLAILSVVGGTAAAGDKLGGINGKVTEVTLYRGQARVIRSIPVEGGPGSLELTVTDLPREIVRTGLFAEAPPGVEVRAVRYRSRAVKEEPREEVRKLDEQLENLRDQAAFNRHSLQLVEKQQAYLDKLENFTASTAAADLSRGVLDADALEKISNFSFQQRETALAKLTGLKKEARLLNMRISVLERQRGKLTAGSSRTVHEAVLFLEKKTADPTSVQLTYLVNQCGWSPNYNFRADSGSHEVLVEYNAVIHQMSGENWDDVSLTLSTASPSLSATGPGLAPFQVALVKGEKSGGDLDLTEMRTRLRSIQDTRQQAHSRNQAAVSQRGYLDTSWAVNSSANDYQMLELNSPPDVLAMARGEVQDGDAGPSLSYRVDGKVSLAGRADRQMIRIMRARLKTGFYYVATPVLTSHVYRETALTNTTPKDLLAGTVNVYLDGRFVGLTEILAVARGQMFVLGFGADPQLRASRELIGREQSTQGGNRVLSFQYRLMFENFKDTAAFVHLQDRVPHPELSADVRLTMGEMKTPLSDDPEYLRLDRPKGILRWQQDVPAHASAENALIVEYAYTLEFDRNLHLSEPLGRQEQYLQNEFETLQIQRGVSRGIKR
ncbi:MAG: mucoidy inhibitor MuiA family protein [Gammaproteobacteria bacterium]|nr:mucoidy inhibitor MuiA family protein [Gammaproteobacteria bacterium]